MSYIRTHWKIFLVGFLLLANVIVWVAVLGSGPKDTVTVSFLDVGQGDSILIEGRNGNRVLIDAGGDKTVLRRLTETLPWFTRSIDVVLETHPDKDHIGGIPYVLGQYSVGIFLEPGVESDNSFDDEIRRVLEKKDIPNMLAKRGMTLDFHDGSFLEILFPDQNVSQWDTNDASIVAKYVYGDTCFILTGDSSEATERYLTYRYGGEDVKCEVLKVGHHGSRTSTSESFLALVEPKYAVISAGKDNKYGHPHEEVVERLQNLDVSVLNTMDQGTITIHSDGKNVFVK